MKIEMEIVLLITLLVCAVEDLLFKKLRVWELAIGTIAVVILCCMDKTMEISAIIPGICLSFMFLVVSLLSKGNFGLGDSWIIGIMGIAMAFQNFVLILGVAFLSAAAASAIIILLKKGKKNMKIPFVPFLLIGYLSQLSIWNGGMQ